MQIPNIEFHLPIRRLLEAVATSNVEIKYEKIALIKRHHYARLKNKVVNHTYFGHSKNDWRCALESKIGFYANTAKCISSALSSNPRNNKWNSKKHQLTLQERRSEFDAKEFNY